MNCQKNIKLINNFPPELKKLMKKIQESKDLKYKDYVLGIGQGGELTASLIANLFNLKIIDKVDLIYIPIKKVIVVGEYQFYLSKYKQRGYLTIQCMYSKEKLSRDEIHQE